MSAIKQYLPYNLNLDAMLREHPPEFKFHRDYFIHLLHLITALPARKKGMLDKSGFVSLNSDTLKKYVHDYRPYMDYLLQQGIIETDNRYVIGKKSIGYRFASQYQCELTQVVITKWTLVKAINRRDAFTENMQRKYSYLHRWFNDELCIDYEGAAQWLAHKLKAETEAGVKNAPQKYSARLLSALQIREQDYVFKVDSTSYRLHTNLTFLHKELRNFMTYGGRQLASVDIRCSQPTMLAALLQEEFYGERPYKELITLRGASSKLFRRMNPQWVATVVRNNPLNISKYLEALQSDLYLYMQQVLKWKGTGPAPTRRQIKDMMFTVLFSGNQFIAQQEAGPKRLFREIFPVVYQVMMLFKTENAADLPILLQKIESELILNRIAKRISIEKPGMPLYTIHDSIVCPVGFENYCNAVIQEEAVKAIGITPTVKVEVWRPENLLRQHLHEEQKIGTENVFPSELNALIS